MKQQQIKKKRNVRQNAAQHAARSQVSARVTEHPYVQAQGIIGNHGLLRRYGSDVIRAKLKVGSPGDKYEQEADRVADEVMRMPEPEVQRQPEEEEEEEILQPKALLGQPPESTSEVRRDSQSTKQFEARDGATGEASNTPMFQAQLGSARPLDSGVKSQMEHAFGMDFSRVSVHTDASAAKISDSLNARAFTVGEHIAFRSGEYQPETLVGQALIAHELAHVAQQGGASSSNASMEKGEIGSVSDETKHDALEEDADRSAVAAILSLWSGAKGALANIARNIAPRLRSGLKLQRCTDDQRRQADAAFRAVVSGVSTGRRQPIPIPMPDPDAARGALEFQYGLNRRDYMFWLASMESGTPAHDPLWEQFYGTNYIDWSHYRNWRSGNFGTDIWPQFLRDVWNNTVPRERGSRP